MSLQRLFGKVTLDMLKYSYNTKYIPISGFLLSRELHFLPLFHHPIEEARLRSNQLHHCLQFEDVLVKLQKEIELVVL